MISEQVVNKRKLSQVKSTFLILVLIQGLHSVEEYIGKLWETFSPARFLTGLVSENREVGFITINIGLFIFGMTYWLIAFRNNQIIAPSILWLWIVLETGNGIGHSTWSIIERSYTPGVLTAPILFIVAIILAKKLLHYSK